ncbi:MAG: T9SS type A sorting domain-containing protein [Saprospiraceae bacterium]
MINITYKIFVVLMISLTTLNLNAQNFDETLKAVASDRGQGHFFGHSVSIDGDYAVIGAVKAGTPNNLFGEQGAVYVFEKDNNNNWQEVKRLVASDSSDMDEFGYSIDISGDYIIVGAYQEDENVNGTDSLDAAGAAYIFYKDEGGTDNWGEVKKLVASDREIDDEFGTSVGISENYAIVGAQYEDHDANGMNELFSAGSAYIFEKDAGGANNWGEIKKLTPSDRESNDEFGGSVLIEDDVIVVGAMKQNLDAFGGNFVINAGAVYIFEKDAGGVNNWGEAHKIVASDRLAGVRFGSSIGMDGDYIVVGARSADSAPNVYSGAAYVFKRDASIGAATWSEVKKLIANDADDNDEFGYAVGVSGDNIIIGAVRESENENGDSTMNRAGSAYIFNKDEGGTNNWGETQKIVASDRAMSAAFGGALAIDGNFIIVGARSESKDAVGGNSIGGAGAAYVFEYTFPSASSSISDFDNLKFYPNPAQELLFIESETIFQQATIYNVLGQPIQEVSIQNNQTEININDLPKGIYMLQLVTENGQHIAKQFIKN